MIPMNFITRANHSYLTLWHQRERHNLKGSSALPFFIKLHAFHVFFLNVSCISVFCFCLHFAFTILLFFFYTDLYELVYDHNHLLSSKIRNMTTDSVTVIVLTHRDIYVEKDKRKREKNGIGDAGNFPDVISFKSFAKTKSTTIVSNRFMYLLKGSARTLHQEAVEYCLMMLKTNLQSAINILTSITARSFIWPSFVMISLCVYVCFFCCYCRWPFLVNLKLFGTKKHKIWLPSERFSSRFKTESVCMFLFLKKKNLRHLFGIFWIHCDSFEQFYFVFFLLNHRFFRRCIFVQYWAISKIFIGKSLFYIFFISIDWCHLYRRIIYK